MTKKETKTLDKLWGEIIRAKGQCEYPHCKKTSYLNAHHIFTRSKLSTRWHIPNGLLLCPFHHTLGDLAAHRDPDFKEIIIKEGVRTRKFFEELRQKAFTPTKQNYLEVLNYLNNNLKKYES